MGPHKRNKSKEAPIPPGPDASKGIKSAMGVASVIGGGANFGGFTTQGGRLKDISERKESPT